jgi:hypothetical protein
MFWGYDSWLGLYRVVYAAARKQVGVLERSICCISSGNVYIFIVLGVLYIMIDVSYNSGSASEKVIVTVDRAFVYSNGVLGCIRFLRMVRAGRRDYVNAGQLH